MNEEICTNCTGTIGLLEHAYVFNGSVVCEECDKELQNGSQLHLNSSNDVKPVDIPQASEGADSDNTQARVKYKGVRGWLLLLCLILTVFSPLGNVVLMAIGFNGVTSYLKQFPGLLTPLVIDTMLRAGLIGFSIYAGMSLWRIRPNAVNIAKAFLCTFLCITILSVFLPLLAGLSAELCGAMIKEGFKQLAGPFCFYWMWNSYLNNSKRVTATYSLVA